MSIYNKILLSLLLLPTVGWAAKIQVDIEKAKDKENIVPVAVIGAGPAGLCTAIYTARQKIPTYIFGDIGGHLNDIERIENWPGLPRTSGERIAKRLEKQATGFGTKTVHDTIDAVNFSTYPFQLTTSRGNKINALSVVIATGFVQEKLAIPGVQQYMGNGIGMCTICDAPFAQGLDVVVIGDDDFAAERVIQLAAYANKVIMVTRKPELSVTAVVRDYLNELDNLEIKTQHAVTEITGDGAKVTGVRVRNLATGAQGTIPAQSVYLNSSYKPNSEIFSAQVDINKDGYITLQNGQKTSVPGVFAAGAVANKPNKAGPCAGYGMAAGVQVIDFMHKTLGFNPEIEKQLEQNYFRPQRLRSLSSIPQVKTHRQLKQVFKEKPITILFAFAPGCPFCKRMYPDIVALAQEFQDKVKLVTLPSHESNELVEDLDFDSLPTTFIFKNGKLLHTIHGKTNKRAVYNVLKKVVESPKDEPANQQAALSRNYKYRIVRTTDESVF